MSQDRLFTVEDTLTVGQLGKTIRLLFTQTFDRDVWVQGQVRGIKRHNNGNVYFDLVEPDPEPGRPPLAKMAVVLLHTTRATVNQQIKAAGGNLRIDDGVELRIRAAPEFYPPNGRVSLKMSGIDPVYTLGKLQADRQQLLQQLQDEDLLERNGRLSLPMLPLRVGLVTAKGSAAAADFLAELRALPVAWEVTHVATQVQGQGAHSQLVRAIFTCERNAVDVIALVRGGGARTDLIAFDHETVARAIASCSVPVLTGVGHEIDRSVADEVAHQAFKTPTAVAQYLSQLVDAVQQHAEQLWGDIAADAHGQLERAHQSLAHNAASTAQRTRLHLHRSDAQTTQQAHLVQTLTAHRLSRAQARLTSHATRVEVSSGYCTESARRLLADMAQTITREAPRRLRSAGQRLDTLDQQRRLLDPVHTLARGWSITRATDGTAVKSVAQVGPGQTLVTTVADGTITSTVEAAVPLPPTQSSASPTTDDSENQEDQP